MKRATAKVLAPNSRMGCASFVESGDRSGIASANLWLAFLAVDSGDWHRATLLHGVAQAFMDQAGEVWQESEAHHREISINEVRARLGDAEFERAYAEGERLSVEAGIRA